MYAVSTSAQFVEVSKKVHLKMNKRLMRYLAGTWCSGFVYNRVKTLNELGAVVGFAHGCRIDVVNQSEPMLYFTTSGKSGGKVISKAS